MTLTTRKPLKRTRTPIPQFSAKRLAALREAGIDHPMSSFASVPALPVELVRRSKVTIRPRVKRSSSDPDRVTVDLVLDRDGYSCVMCGRGVGDRRGVDYSIHHRVLRSQGVDNSPANLITLCGNGTQGDHAAVHARPKWAREFGGWLLKGTDDPATFPVLIERGARWVLLLADGTMRAVPAPETAVAA